VLLALILAASPLAEATHDYSELNYEACITKLARPKALATRERAAGELLWGLCHFALGHEAQARTHVEAALRSDPAVSIPVSASPKEQEFIESVRAASAARRTSRKEAKAEALKVAQVVIAEAREKADAAVKAAKNDAPPEPPSVVDAPATPPPVVVAEPAPLEPPREVPVAALPPAIAAALPGAEPKPARATWLPWLTGGVAVAAAGAGVGFGVSARGLESAARQEPVQVEAGRLANQAQTHATVANVGFAVAGGAAVSTVVAWLLTR
jgi:hypothetical protein